MYVPGPLHLDLSSTMHAYEKLFGHTSLGIRNLNVQKINCQILL